MTVTIHDPLDVRKMARLYWELSRRKAYCTGVKYPWRFSRLSLGDLLVLALAQSRFDPRLLAVLVDFFRKDLPGLDPIAFKEVLRRQGLLPVMAVVGEWILSQGIGGVVRDRIDFWQVGVAPVPVQLFYRNLYPLGGRKMAEAVAHTPWPFKKWGFLAADFPFLKEKTFSERVYLYDPSARLEMLRDLARERQRFTLKDYLNKIRFSVSRQQALQDLNGVSWICKMAKGKGRYYTLAHRVFLQ